MDTAFTHLLAMLCDIADPRRAEGKLYGLPHVFLFSILAVMAGPIPTARSTASSTFTCIGSSRPSG